MHLVLRRIKRIVCNGTEKCFDISFDTPPLNFLLENGVISHNSGVGMQWTKWVGNLKNVKLPRKELWETYCKLKDEKWKTLMANLEQEMTMRELQGKLAKSWYSNEKFSGIKVLPSKTESVENEDGEEKIESNEEMNYEEILNEIKNS